MRPVGAASDGRRPYVRSRPRRKERPPGWSFTTSGRSMGGVATWCRRSFTGRAPSRSWRSSSTRWCGDRRQRSRAPRTSALPTSVAARHDVRAWQASRLRRHHQLAIDRPHPEASRGNASAASRTHRAEPGRHLTDPLHRASDFDRPGQMGACPRREQLDAQAPRGIVMTVGSALLSGPDEPGLPRAHQRPLGMVSCGEASRARHIPTSERLAAGTRPRTPASSDS